MEVADSQYPWPVHIGAALFDEAGHDLALFSSGIRADGRAITSEAAKVHGITTQQAGRSGVPEIVALSAVCHLASQARYLIGFNIEFDRDVLVAAILRHNQDPRRLLRPGLLIIDVMKPAAAFCKLASESGSYRWPSLDEACALLIGEPARTGHHSAWDDLQRTKRLYLWLRDRGAFETAEAA